LFDSRSPGAAAPTWVGVLLALLATQPAAGASPPDAYPNAASSYVVATDDHILWARDADAPRPPASLAKLISALVLLRGDWEETRILSISKAAAAIEGTQLGLREGEQIRAGDALTAMLVRSANDACVALAEDANGATTAFVQRMNALAAELGLRRTVFRTPCGLDAPGQRTTANDMLALARAAMQRDEIAHRVSRERASIVTLSGRKISFTNNNALVGRTPGAIGVKSGFTSAAGKCVIALTERDGRRVWLVMLDAPNRWWTAEGIITAAFASMAHGGS
jgi:serine-type D-Ala-D-Ala carboxypeptidase (penicillin-binding protein 5/6)